MFTPFQQPDLSYIDPQLEYIASNVQTPYGVIDILAQKQGRPVAIKEKHGNYQSSSVIGHLHQYARAMQERNGEVYFVAPYITTQLQLAFQAYVDIHLLTRSPSRPVYYQNVSQARKTTQVHPLEKKVQKILQNPLLNSITKKLLG